MKPQVQGLWTIFDTNTQGPFNRQYWGSVHYPKQLKHSQSLFSHFTPKMKLKTNIHHCSLLSVHHKFPSSYFRILLWMGLFVQTIFGFSQVSCVLLENGTLPGLASESGVSFCAERNTFLTGCLRGFAPSCVDDAFRRWNCRDKIHIHLVQLN